MIVLLLLATLSTSRVGAQEAAGSPDTADAAGTDDTGNLLQISSVTPWVSPDGEFQVRFAPTSSVPAGAKLTYSIYQALQPTNALTLRDQVNAVIEGGSPGKYLQGPEGVPLTTYGDPAAGSTLTIPIRSSRAQEANRALLPNPGIHPITLVLTDTDRAVLWSQVVFLNRLPADYVLNPSLSADAAATAASAAEHPSVAVTLMLPVQTPPTLGIDGTPAISVDQQASLESITALLTQVPEAPFTLAARPNTLDGLSRIGERWSQQLLQSITGALAAADGDGSGGARLLALPYVGVDTGGLVAADAADDLTRQMALGGQVSTEIVGQRGETSTWALDESLTPESVPWLSSHGIDSVVVPSSALERPGAVSEQRTMTAGVQLEGASGVRAIAYDSVLTQRLSDVSVEPGVRAHDAVAVMMAAWFGAPGSAPTSVLMLPPTIDPDVIRSLAPSLAGPGPLVADVTAPIVPPSAAGVVEPTVGLARTTGSDERAAVAETANTRSQIEAYRSMIGDADPVVLLWERLNAETLAADLPLPQRLALHNSVRTQIAADTGAIKPPRERPVLLTSRDQNIPLRITNGLPYDVRLILRARSPRLEIEGGDGRVILLKPGDNRIDLPVTVRAPGETQLKIELMSPDEQLQIASLDVPVRSTAISGVGAALSIISVLFLIVWWVHTHRRKKRTAARANGGHPALSPTDPDGSATEPSSAAPMPDERPSTAGSPLGTDSAHSARSAADLAVPEPADTIADLRSTNDEPRTGSVT